MNKLLNTYLKKLWHESAALNNSLFLSLIEQDNNLKILDLGCDDGRICLHRFKKNKELNIYGIDIDRKKLKIAKKMGIKTYQSDLEKRLPFPNNFFDVITANQIIEHLTNTDSFIKEIYRILKPNGYLIMSTENLSSWHNIFALLFGWHPFSLHVSQKKNIGNPARIGNITFSNPKSYHIKNFTLRSIKELCQLYDFTIEKTYGAGYYPIPGIFSKIMSKFDQQHAAFIGLKARKNY